MISLPENTPGRHSVSSKLKQSKYIYVILFSLVCFQAGTQTTIPGLIDNINGFVTKDSKGFTWISSLNGINRFDGKNLKYYKPNKGHKTALQEGLIQSTFYEDKNADLWFVTTDRLYRYNRATDDFTNFVNPIDSVGYHRLIDMIDDVFLLVQIGDKVYSFDITSRHWKHIYTGFHGYYFAVDQKSDGQISAIYGTREIDGKGLLKLSFEDGIETTCDTLLQTYFMSQVLKKDRVLWITGDQNLIQVSFDGGHRIIKGPDESVITSIVEYDNDQTLLVSTKTNVYSYDITQEEFEPWIEDAECPMDLLFYFGANELYGSSYTTGLNIMPINESPVFKMIGTDDAIITDLSLFSINNNEYIMYATAQNQLFVCDIKTGNVEEYKLDCNAVLWSNTASEPIFICGQRIMRVNFKEKNVSTLYDAPIGRTNGAIYSTDRLMFFNLTGVIVLDRKSKKILKLYPGERLGDTYGISDKIYTVSDSIFELNLNSRDLEKTKSIPFYGSISHFSTFQDSLLYFSSGTGVVVLNLNTLKVEQNHFIESYIQSMAICPDRTLWAGAQGVLYQRNPEGDVFVHNEGTGLPADMFLEGLVRKTSDGRLWWGASKGVVYFHPDSVTIPNYDVPVLLNSLKIHGHEWAEDTINIEEINEVELNYNQNTLTFDLTAIDYSSNSHPQFRVSLKGHDVDTINIGQQSQVTYPNLAPGRYTFLYSVCTMSGVCKKNFNQFEIVIHPPFWKTWWFKFLLCLAGISVIIGGIRFYIRNRLREQKFRYDKQQLILQNELQLQKERNRIADELHDELGGKLSSIKFAGKKVERAKSIDEVKNINRRVSELSTELIDSMRSIIWAMDTHNDSLSSLLANIRQYASTLAKDNDLSLEFDFPEIDEKVVVKGQIRHHMYLAIKEILNNILKHSTADRVRISASFEAKQVTMSIWENGQGYDTSIKRGQGKGLKSIKKRVSMIDGNLLYDQSNGVATHIQVPL